MTDTLFDWALGQISIPDFAIGGGDLSIEAAHDPGGQRLPLPPGVVARAIYGGAAECYRYRLEWVWDALGRTLMVLLMNPSCAGHECGDRTVAKMHRIARRLGYSRLLIANASAYRVADQNRLAEARDACGPDNVRHVLAMAAESEIILVGYGQPKVRSVSEHGPRMVRILLDAGYGAKLHIFALGKEGSPKHPLYLSEAGLVPVPWAPAFAPSAAPEQVRP